MAGLTIQTSNVDWIKQLALAYASRCAVRIIDDAKIGITPAQQSILEMGRQANLTAVDWAGVLVSLGVSGVGVGMIVLAFVDPEPTSKLWLLVCGGILCTYTGGSHAIRILTNQYPPNVKVSATGFEISWD